MKVFLTDLADISKNTDLIHRYEGMLSESDRARYTRITDPNRRLQFLTGRALIQENCRENPTLSKTGKPMISKGYISLSHAGPFVTLITSDSPVGIDLEDSSRIRPFKEISRRLHFSATDKVEFYKQFTQYESDYKLGVKSRDIYHLFYSINTFILCISLLNNNENINFIKSIPFVKNIPFAPRILS